MEMQLLTHDAKPCQAKYAKQNTNIIRKHVDRFLGFPGLVEFFKPSNWDRPLSQLSYLCQIARASQGRETFKVGGLMPLMLTKYSLDQDPLLLSIAAG